MINGRLYIISAPSGAGKTSIVKQIALIDQNLQVSISHTTRPIRPGEIDGTNYYFINQEKFDELQKQNAFLEYACVHQYSYGTTTAFVMEQLQAGFDVILEIDWQGAQQIRKTFTQTKNLTSIFILPPSMDSLKKRLLERGQDSNAIIEQRLINAYEEISHYQEFDYLIINDIFKKAVEELQAIIKTQRLQCAYVEQTHWALIKNLL